MTIEQVSPRIARLLTTVSPFLDFYNSSKWRQRRHEPNISDFFLGNPQEMPLPGFVDALQRWAEPQNKDWFAYQDYQPEAQKIISKSLSAHRGIEFKPEDILITSGAFAGLAVMIAVLTNPGDEVIFISPPWFFYEGMILEQGAIPVRVRMDEETYDLDLVAIEAAITESTRALIINSPNNPTGKVYPPETLKTLSKILNQASQKYGHAIYIISDEPYSRIVFGGQSFPSPAKYYPNTFLIYSYGKTLLVPGQRIGYIALPPNMLEKTAFREAIFAAQLFTGWAFANAILQHSIVDIEKLSIDIEHYQEKRDQMVMALRKQGYDVKLPEGTFYLLVRSPLKDDMAFIDLLTDYDVFCLPGSVFEMPGYFRMSLTANDEMIARALPGFEAAINKAQEIGQNI